MNVATAAGVVRRLPRALSLAGRYGRPGAVLYFGESPGDDLLATAVLRQWHQTCGRRAAYLTQYPELFRLNPDVAFTAPYDPALAGALRLLGVPRVRLRYHDYDPQTDRSRPATAGHIVNLMCRAAGLPPVDDPTPLLHLDPAEIPPAPRRRVVMQSSVRSSRLPIVNKDWFPERMNEVARALAPHAEVVQLGTAADPPLDVAIDLRGRTSLREACGYLASARLFIGMVGFLMHAAAAVGTRSVIVYGGREHPTQSGYPRNRNLFTPLPCAPCWLWSQCDYERDCMRRISADEVVAAALPLLIT